MSKISIEGTPVPFNSSGFGSISGHLLLIYQDDGGNEYVVRGGPTPNPLDGSDYGALILHQNIPMLDLLNNPDKRFDANGNPVTPASRGNTEIPLNGRNADDVWNLILQTYMTINFLIIHIQQ
jgi:hypothetical protein